MKKCLPFLICLGIALVSACSKKSKVTPVMPPPVVDPIKQNSTPPPPPPFPYIDTFVGSYIDSLFNDSGGPISASSTANIMFSVQYTAGDMVIFRSLQVLPVGGQNTPPWIYYYAFADTFVKSPANFYATDNHHFYTINGDGLSVEWAYEHYTYFQISKCLYMGMKQ